MLAISNNSRIIQDFRTICWKHCQVVQLKQGLSNLPPYINIIYMYLLIYIDEPYDAFEVHFLMKTKHVLDETSFIVSCIMRNKMKLCNK